MYIVITEADQEVGKQGSEKGRNYENVSILAYVILLGTSNRVSFPLLCNNEGHLAEPR
jgi:hypothetical protein